MIDRQALLIEFLHRHGWQEATLFPLPADASFRRYIRISQHGKTAIVMDAPPLHEKVDSFISVNHYLRQQGLAAPEIFATDTENGFLLLEDFGDTTFTKVLQNHPAKEIALYQKAIDILIELQAAPPMETLEDYSQDHLITEATLLLEWYFPTLYGEPLSRELQEAYLHIWKKLLPLTEQLPTVTVLRDYHADNLMWQETSDDMGRVGILDFQDALRGSPIYDMVSLLEDARRDVSPATVQAMISRYLEGSPQITRKDFLASYAILGAQRNFKIVGIFARKAARDKQAHYLKFLPRVWRHISNDLTHPLLLPLKEWLNKAMSQPIKHNPQPLTSNSLHA